MEEGCQLLEIIGKEDEGLLLKWIRKAQVSHYPSFSKANGS